MKKKFTSSLLWVFAVVASMSAFVSCKDYESDDMAELNNITGNQATAIAILQQNVLDLQDEIDSKYVELKGLIDAINSCECDEDLKADKAVVDTLARRVAALQGQLNDLQDKSAQIDVNRDSIQKLLGLINELNRNAYTASQTEQLINQIINDKGLKDVSDDLTDIKARVKVLETDTLRLVEVENKVIGLTEEMKEAKSTAAKALALAQADSIRLDAIDGDLTQVKADIANLKAKDATLDARIDSLAKATADSVKVINAKVSDIEKAVKNLQDKDADLQRQIDELQKIADMINNNYATTLKKLITGIIIQGTENDVTGYAALPLDVQSNILAAYYGVAAKDVTFPEAGDYLTPADVAGVKVFTAKSGDTLINESPNNAGTLYLTVNPNTSDFSGIRPSLVNSKDQESAVKLGELKQSDKVLTWGITRAENNAFYEVAATLDKSKINEAKVDFNKEAVVNSIKNFIKQKSVGSLTAMASVVYGNFNGAFERNGVKVEYTDDVLGDRGIYSEYSILATAIKPLSYDFYAGKSLTKLRTFDFSSIVEKLNFNVDSINIKLDGIETKVSIPVALSVDVPINATATADAQKIYVKLSTGETRTPGGTDTIYAEGYVTVPATDGTIKDTLKVEKTFTTTADLADFLSSLLPDIQGQINSSIASMVSGINGKISNTVSDLQKNYVNRINNLIQRVNAVLANPNRFIQPTMLYEGADGGFHFLNHATFKLGGAGMGTPLVATSRSAEIVAPAMKRFVKVVSAPAGADLEALNSKDYNMNKVVNGSEKIFIFAPTVAGQYEIVYSALDYAGQTRTVKYTVNVVE
jgi:cell division protein FtsB